MAKRKGTIQREEEHEVHGSLAICKDWAHAYAKELKDKKIKHKVNEYFFHDGVTQKGYKVIPFDDISKVKVYKIAGNNVVPSIHEVTEEISTPYVPIKNRPIDVHNESYEDFHNAMVKEINENIKNNSFIKRLFRKFTNLLKNLI